MKILVTGGNGFLGKPIAEFLLRKKHELVILDIESNNLKPHPKMRTILGSMEEKEKTDQATEDIEAVYHLALNYCEDLTDFFVSNIKGTINLLRSAAQNKVKHFLYCSSSAVYGAGTFLRPLDETYPCHSEGVDISKMPSGIPGGAKLGYGILKLALEKLCLAFGKNYNLPITVLRIIGGFGGKYNGVKPPGYHLIQKALTNQTIQIERGAKIFTTWVEDAARAFLLATQNPKAFFQIFNVFSFSIFEKDLASFILKTTNSKSEIKIICRRRPPCQYNQGKIKRILDFRPKGKPVDLKRSLKKYIGLIKTSGKY